MHISRYICFYKIKYSSLELSIIDPDSSENKKNKNSNHQSDSESSLVIEEELTWISCAGQLENLINDFNLCNTLLSKVKSDPYPNPIIFILESIQVISTIKDKAIQFLINSKKVVEKMTSVENENENYVFDDLIFHDPGKRGPVTSSPQRQYLINLGPFQPKLLKFPVNSKINKSKQNRFNPKWYCEYPLLEYNASYCFACTLFPKGNGRQSSDLAWISKGVNQWHKMKSRGIKKLGKLQQHFSSLSHKAALHDYCHFMSKSNHIDFIINKYARVEAIKLNQEKEFNKQVITILIDVT
ncbi:zinc finger MYM-type protein 1-like, partial [Aphis craccivora]